MFDINDYINVETFAQGGTGNPKITAEVTLNKEALHKDVKDFKYILKQLQNLIGPYTIIVDNKKTKIKKNKKKKKK